MLLIIYSKSENPVPYETTRVKDQSCIRIQIIHPIIGNRVACLFVMGSIFESDKLIYCKYNENDL